MSITPTRFTDDDLDLLRADLDAAGLTRQHVIDELESRDDLAVRRSRRSSRPSRPRRRLLAAAAVAAIATGTLGAPALLGSDAGGAIALGPATPLEFPLSVTPPAGLGAPAYGLDGAQKYVLWGESRSDDGLSVAVHEGIDLDELGEVPSSAAEVTVHGQDAYSFRSAAGWTVAWEEGGDAVRVTGRGDLAAADQVLAVAQATVDEPVSVGIPFSVTPEGWEVTAYNEIAVTVTDDGDPARQLTAVRIDGPSSGLAGYGASDVVTRVVDGRDVTTGRVAFDDGTGWIAEAQDPDGAWFSVQAPQDLTRTQVERVALGIG